MRFYSRGRGTHACQGNLCHLSLALLALQILDQGTLTPQRTHLLYAVRGSGVEPLPEVRPTCLGAHAFLPAPSQYQVKALLGWGKKGSVSEVVLTKVFTESSGKYQETAAQPSAGCLLSSHEL